MKERNNNMKKTILPVLATLTLCTSALGVTAFAADDTVTPDPASATTDITAKLTLPTGGGTVVPPIIDPTDPDKPGGDNGTGIQGNFGIAYVPNALTGQAELATSGAQAVSLTDANRNPHIIVCDRSVLTPSAANTPNLFPISRYSIREDLKVILSESLNLVK